MSNNNGTTGNVLSNLSREDLLALLTQVLTNEPVAQAPAKAPAKATKPACGRTKSSDGEPCTRPGTQDDGACKSHTGDWDNGVAKAKAAKSQDFVNHLRERAQDKAKGGRADNKALAAAIRSLGGTPNGDTWTTAKALVAEGESIEAAAVTAVATA